jgi:hypothetical protein
VIEAEAAVTMVTAMASLDIKGARMWGFRPS